MTTLAKQDDEMAMSGDALRTVGKRRFPAESFAFAPDPDKPSAWQILLANEAGKITRKSLGRATAYLSPGGCGGQRAEITTANLPKVKARIRHAYRQIGVAEADIPHWVQEKETMPRTPLAQVHAFDESAFDTEKHEITLTVIKPGMNTSGSRFYPPDTLKRDFGVFEGAKMFKNHPTARESKERPEGSVDDHAAQIKEVWAEEDGTIKAKAFVHDPAFREKLKNMADGGILKEMGASIRAVGEGVKGTIKGAKTCIVEALTKARSVDFVTSAGAGGAIEVYESEENMETNIEFIDEKSLRDQRPDLVELIEAGNEADKSLERTVEEMTETVEGLTKDLEAKETAIKEVETERDGLKEQLEESQRVEARAKATEEIKEAIAKADDLPEPTQAKLAKQFAEAETSEGIEEAIKTELDYLKALTDKGVVNMGESAAPEEKEDAEGEKALAESLETSYIRGGMEPEAAKAQAIREAAE